MKHRRPIAIILALAALFSVWWWFPGKWRVPMTTKVTGGKDQ